MQNATENTVYEQKLAQLEQLAADFYPKEVQVEEKVSVAEEHETVSYIAGPQDDRCAWWSARLPELTVEHLEERISLKYFKSGSDHELAFGEMIIDSEAKHHRKSRGYDVVLGVVVCEQEGLKKVTWIEPTMAIKQHIKMNGGKHLMKGTGEVAAVIRLAMWLREQKDLVAAVREILEIS